MEDYFDSDKQKLREGFYIGKGGNTALLIYLSREGDKWKLEMPGRGKKYEFNAKLLAGEVKRVNNIDELLRTTREDWVTSRYLCGQYDDRNEEFPQFPEGLVYAQDRFLFVQTRMSKN